MATTTNEKPIDYNLLRNAKPLGDSPINYDLLRSAKPLPTTGLGRTLGDAGITALKSTIGVPEAAIGLADIATSGRAGKFAEGLGFRPKEAKEILNTYYSPEQQRKQAEVRNAQGFFPTLGAYAEYPSVLAHDIGEQVAPMLGGGIIGQGVRKVLPKVAPYIAGAIGEGALTAGQNVEQVRQETPGGLLDPLKQTLPVAASGALTGAIAAVSGKLANRFGVTDIQTLMAGGATPAALGAKGIARNIAGSAILEGPGQELPQSTQEQIAQNYAEEKPLMEGVGSAAAQGLALGTVMGAGGAAIDPVNYQPKIPAPPPGPLTRAAAQSPVIPPTPTGAISGTQTPVQQPSGPNEQTQPGAQPPTGAGTTPATTVGGTAPAGTSGQRLGRKAVNPSPQPVITQPKPGANAKAPALTPSQEALKPAEIPHAKEQKTENATQTTETGQDAKTLLDQPAPEPKTLGAFTPTHVDKEDNTPYMQYGDPAKGLYVDEEQHADLAAGKEVTPWGFEPEQLESVKPATGQIADETTPGSKDTTMAAKTPAQAVAKLPAQAVQTETIANETTPGNQEIASAQPAAPEGKSPDTSSITQTDQATPAKPVGEDQGVVAGLKIGDRVIEQGRKGTVTEEINSQKKVVWDKAPDDGKIHVSISVRPDNEFTKLTTEEKPSEQTGQKQAENAQEKAGSQAPVYVTDKQGQKLNYTTPESANLHIKLQKGLSADTHEAVKIGNKWYIRQKPVAAQSEHPTGEENLAVQSAPTPQEPPPLFTKNGQPQTFKTEAGAKLAIQLKKAKATHTAVQQGDKWIAQANTQPTETKAEPVKSELELNKKPESEEERYSLENTKKALAEAEDEYAKQGMVKNARTRDLIDTLKKRISSIEHPVIHSVIPYDPDLVESFARTVDYNKGWQGSESKESQLRKGLIDTARSRNITPQYAEDYADRIIAALKKSEAETKAPEPTTKAEVNKQDHAKNWDALDYGGRQAIAQASDIGGMRKVVHRISGSKWQELSPGEQDSMLKAMAKAPEPTAKAPEAKPLSQAELEDKIYNDLVANKKLNDVFNNKDNQSFLQENFLIESINDLLYGRYADEFTKQADNDFKMSDRLVDRYKQAVKALEETGQIGLNANSSPVYQDENGVRHIYENGVRVTETLTLVPYRDENGNVKYRYEKPEVHSADYLTQDEIKATAKQTWITPEYTVRLDRAKLKLRRAIETTAFDALTSDPTAPADNDTIIGDLLAHLTQAKVTAEQAGDTSQQDMLDLMLDGNKITLPSEFIESVKKQRSKNSKANELAKNREPAVYHDAVAKSLVDYGITAEKITAFTQGFDHHLAGKTLSTLPPGNKTMIAGFKAAEEWTKTEEGSAWLKGEKRTKKLEATGTVLKRWFDKTKADIEDTNKTDADIAKAQIDTATSRAAFFRDIAGDNATPGLLRYLDTIRSKVTPFKEWFVSEIGIHKYRSDRGFDSLITDYLKDGSNIYKRTDLKHDTVEQRIANLKQFAARYVDEVGQIVEVVAGTSDMRTASDKLAKAFINEDAYQDMQKKLAEDRGWTFYLNYNQFSPLAKKLEALLASSEIRRLLPANVQSDFKRENDAATAKPISPRNPRIDQVYRNGKDWRKGKDITPKQFKAKFGFADFNFGKYVTKKNDQDHLNYAYDALSDFAELMDIDPKAIGFNGKLYFTIGALGHGKFAAHFSPNNPSDKGPVPVINLTNTQGDGTVAHEWLHALDELAPELDDAIFSIKQELKQAYNYDEMKRRVIQHLKGQSFFTSLKNNPVASAQYALKYYRGKGYSDFYNAALALDKGNLSKPYWSNANEPFARAGEAAVMDLLEDKNLTNNYLVNNDFVGEGKAVPPMYKGTPYPTGEERKRFKDYYKALFQAITFADGKWQFDRDKFLEAAPKTRADYDRALAELSDSIPDMYRQLQDEKRAGKLLEEMEQAKQAKERMEAERLALEAKLAEELADKARTEAKPDPSGAVTGDEFDALFADVVSELKADESEKAPIIAGERDKELPRIKRLADSDKAFLLDAINRGDRILMANKDFGLPTIHDFVSIHAQPQPQGDNPSTDSGERINSSDNGGITGKGNSATAALSNLKVEHMGYGLFKAVGPDFTIHFDAGGAMQKTPGGESYTVVAVKSGVFPYDFDAAKQALSTTAKPEPQAKPEKAPATKPQDFNATEPTEKPVKQQVKKDLERIASLGVQGMGEVLNGLHELFGGKGTLSSFPGGLDAESYAKAKPHFEKALALFQEAGLTLRDMIKELVLTFGEGIQPYLRQFVMEKKLSVNLQAEKQQSGSQKLAGFVAGELKAGRQFTWQTLFNEADKAFKGTMAANDYSVKDAYDAMESGVNQYILGLDKYNPQGKSVAEAQALINDLNRLLDNIPTQTKRTAEQDEFQQFSTPPTEAFAANWVANIQAGETMVEPSAGIGGLAIFAKLAGANIVLNELSQRRAGVLSEVFPGVKVYTENAEQLANVLPAEIQPSVIVMNPPFSSTAGRMEGKRNTKNGAKHIEQALKKLAPNGRLVAIVGQGMAMDAPAFKTWWADISKKYAVRANISVNGAEYRKYGTTFDNQLVVIDVSIHAPSHPQGDNTLTDSGERINPSVNGEVTGKDSLASAKLSRFDVVTGRAETIADLIPMLEGIRNERIRPNLQAAELNGAEPSGEQTVDAGGKGGLPGPQDTGVNAPGERQPGELDNANGTGLPGQRGHRVPANGTGKTGTGKGHGNYQSDNEGPPLDGQPGSGGGRTGGKNGQPGLSIESVHKAAKEGAITDAIYENYQPAFLKIPGSKDHPGKLVESAAMAAVDPPAPTYTPNLPKATITQGKLSLPQLEATVYAGQSFEKFLKDGPRRGYMIGDGTGTGKGREISGVILDAMRQGYGKKKAVWLSVSPGLYNDSKGYYEAIGGDASKVFKQTTGFDAPKEKEGILFASYDWLRGEDAKTKKLSAKGQLRSHVDTLVDWLGKDFDGVIAFDESHKMQNAQAQSGKNASKTAMAGIRLQELLPQARILYASATAATEVSNFLYADRLGLWGMGTAFSNKGDFVNQIVSAGTAAMEFVAQGMKAAGVYLSRSLSFDGVTQGMINHELTPEQKDVYNGLAETWQNLWLQMRQQAVENGDTKFKGASMFWGHQQRFFNAAITALSMPSVIQSAQADLDKGESVLFQLTSTGKAQQDREVARGVRENLELEELDFSPKQAMIDMVRELYPIHLYESYTDDNGNEQTRLVLGADDKPVINREALAKRDELIKNLESVRVLDNPLDMIIDAFGVDKVAEVTGRNARYIWERDKDGAMKRVKQVLSKNSKEKDVNAFMDGKKQILIFSEAGGTGFSYHADNTRKNTQHRNHYLVQAGWQANKAIQGLGRSHRTNEASQPHYWLVTTDLRGQKRFISSIARRLDQLGALTKGQRETGGQGMFNAADNLENAYATSALKLFLRDMFDEQIEGMTIDNMASAKLGFDNLVNQQTGQFNENNVPKTTQFLNRMLSLTYEDQNRVFEEFANRIDELVTTAKQNGTYDEGIKTLHAQKIEKVSEETIYQDEETGALAKFVTLNLTHPMNFNDFESMQGLSSLANWQGFYWDKKNKRMAGVLKSGTKTQANGLVTDRGSVYLPFYKSSQKIYIDDLAKITEGKATFGEKVMIPKYNGPDLYESYLQEGGTQGMNYDRRVSSNQIVAFLEQHNGEQKLNDFIENERSPARKQAYKALYEKMKPDIGEQEKSIQVPQYEEKTAAEAAALWQKNISESPQTFAETVTMIKGVILPIWDRIPGSTVGIRAQTSKGEVIIGRDIKPKDVPELRRNFALGSPVSKLSGAEQWSKLQAGSEGTLSNGWRLTQVRVSGDKRIELVMSLATTGDVRMVESIGVFGEKIPGSWSTRYFVPSEKVFTALTELKPLVELTGLEATPTTGSNEDSIAVLNLGSHRVNMNGVDYFSARAVVKRVVAASKKNWNVDIIAVPSFDALPSEVKKDTIYNYGNDAARNSKGITHKGKVYIIAKNSDSIADIEATILHEVEGHIGIHRLFGNDINQQLNALYVAIGGRSGLTKLVKNRGIAEDINGYAKLIGKSQFSDDVRIQVMMDEVLAHYAQHPKFGDRVKSIIGAIRAWLRQHGFLKLSEYGDTDLLNILREGRKQLKKSSDVNTELPMLRLRNDYTQEAEQPEVDTWLSKWLNRTNADTAIYNLQDRYIDLYRQMQKITKQGGVITESENARMGEEVSHQRIQSRIKEFYDTQFNPILKELHDNKLDMDAFQKVLQARHAPSRNAVMAERNPNQEIIDEKLADAEQALEDAVTKKEIQAASTEVAKWSRAKPFKGTEEERLSLSGMTDEQAQDTLDNLTPEQKRVILPLADKIDVINNGTLDLMVDYGMETPESIQALKDQWEHYVPLHRDEAHPDDANFGHPIGRGYSIRGTGIKTATGSNAEVTNIMAHIAAAREQMLRRGEKNMVTVQLAEFITNHPDPNFAVTKPLPTKDYLVNGLVETLPDPTYKDKNNVVVYREKGKDKALIFNEYVPENVRLAMALKNMNGIELDKVESLIAKGTRWLASVNTQFNVVFGLMNVTRDVQSAMLNLTSTPLAGKQRAVFSKMGDSIKIIAGVERGWANTDPALKAMYERFNKAGGTTAYSQMFEGIKDRDHAIRNELKKLNEGKAMHMGRAVVKALSDFNTIMENSTRLSVFMTAVESGLSDMQAASLAKNITVNFNRKGAYTTKVGSMYAFFNASMQGSFRMAETLKGPAGKKILIGGVGLGAALTILGIAAMGADDWDKIPEFIKERSLIIPAPWNSSGYIAIPMPLGFHILPNIGRKFVESMFGSDRISTTKRFAQLASTSISAFNPLGGSDISGLVMPTVLDPALALWRNQDWTGKTVYQQDFNSLDPTPGFSRAKDTATTAAKWASEAANTLTGGTSYKPGLWSPTPDQIDYVMGQLTGGTGRELLKAQEVIAGIGSDEELPTYKIPLIGRLYGNVKGDAAERATYYDNVKLLNEQHNEVEGLLKEPNGRAKAAAYLRENPLARIYNRAHVYQKMIDKLKKRPGSERRIVELMKKQNDLVQSATG